MSTYSNQNSLDRDSELSNSNHHQRLRHRVELQSMHIEKILAKNQVHAEVNGGSLRQGWIDFNIQAQLADGLQKIRQIRDELVFALNVPDVKIKRQNGSLKLLVKKDVPHSVDLLDLNDESLGIPGVGVVIGISEARQPIILNLSSPDINNILITGVDGAGKSGLIRTFATSIALSNRQSDVQLTVISAGNGSRNLVTRSNPLYPLNYLPHLLFPIATTVEDAIATLDFLVEEINFRLDNSLQTPLIVLLIDDIDWLLMQGGQELYNPLAELLEVSAESGLRIVISATGLNVGSLSRLLKHNASLRFVGRVENADQAFYLTGELDTGAEYLNGCGDFLAVTLGNQIHFQAAYIDDYDLHMTLGNLHRPKQGVLLARRMRGVGENGNAIQDESPINFSYDSVNGRATIDNSREDETDTPPAVILENSNPERSFEDEVTNHLALSPRVNSMGFVNSELPIFHDPDNTTSDEIPGFLSNKPAEQTSDQVSNEEELSHNGPSELEYSEIDDDIEIDIDDEWEPPSRSDSYDSEQRSKKYH